MQASGTADLVLMGGSIPPWLFQRMVALCRPMVESMVLHYGQDAFLQKLSHPFWFQSFGAVLGMDWNSSGVTTAVMAALKMAVNPMGHELGLHVCGGKGKSSLQTPEELLRLGHRTGLDAQLLVRSSRLAAKVDNTALQDGHTVYLHNFVVSRTGQWAVVQQGMDAAAGTARRYHWSSQGLGSFVWDPHAAICGDNKGTLLNLVDAEAAPCQQAMLQLTGEPPEKLLAEIPHMQLPKQYGVKEKDVDLKRLGAVLWLAQENEVQQFEDLLLLKGLGPRTLQSLALVSEVVHGTASRFADPARFSFAHGGKGAKPFPVPTAVYDEAIATMAHSVERAKLGDKDKFMALKKLTEIAQKSELNFVPTTSLQALMDKENAESHLYGGRTMSGMVEGIVEKQ